MLILDFFCQKYYKNAIISKILYIFAVTMIHVKGKPDKMIANNLTPFAATHPGEMIKDELKERHMTQKQLEEMTGIQQSVISETINGKRSLSLNFAIALEKVFGISADVLMNMQTKYDIDIASIAKRDNKSETVKLTIPESDHSLLLDLVRKFGWACAF